MIDNTKVINSFLFYLSLGYTKEESCRRAGGSTFDFVWPANLEVKVNEWKEVQAITKSSSPADGGSSTGPGTGICDEAENGPGKGRQELFSSPSNRLKQP